MDCTGTSALRAYDIAPNRSVSSTLGGKLVYVMYVLYSETSDKGHSKRGQTSQQRTSQKYSCIHTL